MAAERQQVGDLVDAVEDRNEMVLEIELIDRIRGRNIHHVVLVHLGFGHAVAHLHQVA